MPGSPHTKQASLEESAEPGGEEGAVEEEEEEEGEKEGEDSFTAAESLGCVSPFFVLCAKQYSSVG